MTPLAHGKKWKKHFVFRNAVWIEINWFINRVINTCESWFYVSIIKNNRITKQVIL